MLDGRDKILGILPFFHSFGFMAALWMPAVQGVGVVYHPNPLDAQVIGELVEKYKVTFLVATPTFLQAYMRRCSPGEFRVFAICTGGRGEACRSALRWRSKTPSAFARWKATAARSVRPWSR